MNQKLLAIEAAGALTRNQDKSGWNAAEQAIADCAAAFARELKKCEAKAMPSRECRARAIMAYKINIPAMVDKPSIMAAVAAITHAMYLELVNGQEASRLLYAAQVALSATRTEGTK